MKKTYQTPEVEIIVNDRFCQTIIEGPSDNNGEVEPMGNENKTFEENDIMDVSAPTNLWDD